MTEIEAKAQSMADKWGHTVYLCKGDVIIILDYWDAKTYGIVKVFNPLS